MMVYESPLRTWLAIMLVMVDVGLVVSATLDITSESEPFPP